MNNERHADSPVKAEQAPDHGPGFWDRFDQILEHETGSQASTQFVAANDKNSADATSQMPGIEESNTTTQMPRLASVDAMNASSDAAGVPRLQRTRLAWPAAAAAVAIVVLGLGLLVARSGSDPATTTELVAEPSTVDGGAAAEGAGHDVIDDDSSAADPDADGSTAGVDDAANNSEPATSVASQDADDDEPVNQPAAAPIPEFESARGAVGEPDYVPLDQGVPADGTYLANWPERALTWFAVTDPAADCTDPAYSEIRYVNGSGFTQDVRDPQLRFSGEISHFVVRHEQNVAAWVVACGEQLELHIATLDPTGRFDTPTLVWLGEGSSSAALVQWAPNAVSFNAIEPGGEAFSIEYNLETGLLSRNGGPSRIMIEEGAPAARSLTPLGSSPSGGLTYWQGTAPAGTESACADLSGSGRSDMVWLRQGEGQWLPAVPDGFAVGSITAGALDSASLQFAFGDVCANESGRVLVGRQLPDGRISDLTSLDLTPFVPGYAAQLFWVDDQTLRIETDNSEFGFGTVRFDYRLDEQILEQLD